MSNALIPKLEDYQINDSSRLPTIESLASQIIQMASQKGRSYSSNVDENNYGTRFDGSSNKGAGYFGELPRKGGGYSTELSVGVNLDGKEVEIPLLNPSLNSKEINHLLSGGKPTQEMIDKSVAYAKQRWDAGKSQWANPQDRLIARPGYEALPSKDMKLREHIAGLESKGSGSYKARSGNSQFLGRYQIGTKQLIETGYKNTDGSWTGKDGITSDKDFLNSPKVQDKAYQESIRVFDQQLKNHGTYKYIGQTINTASGPITLTHDKILAGAHNAGAYGIHKWLSGQDPEPRDDNGTPASKFMTIKQ